MIVVGLYRIRRRIRLQDDDGDGSRWDCPDAHVTVRKTTKLVTTSKFFSSFTDKIGRLQNRTVYSI